MVPCVVSAVKLGASSLIRSDMPIVYSRTKAHGAGACHALAERTGTRILVGNGLMHTPAYPVESRTSVWLDNTPLPDIFKVDLLPQENPTWQITLTRRLWFLPIGSLSMPRIRKC